MRVSPWESKGLGYSVRLPVIEQEGYCLRAENVPASGRIAVDLRQLQSKLQNATTYIARMNGTGL